LFNRYWPRLALAANGTYLNTNSRIWTTGSSNLDTLQSSSWNGAVGIGFNWSIFDGGIAAAQAEADKALALQLSDQAAVQRLQVSEEVEQSYASYEASQLAILSSREQAISARKAAVSVRERFNVGYADTTSVVQTLNQAINAANAYARSQREYNSAVARLYRSSAQWPDNTQALRDRRVLSLKRR
jgi:outer membrane protein TolC